MTFIGTEAINMIKNNYFWTIFYLDLGSFIYFIYNNDLNDNNSKNDNKNQLQSNNDNDLKVTINTLKNKINNILTPDGSLQISSQEPVLSFSSNNLNSETQLNNTNQNNTNQSDNLNTETTLNNVDSLNNTNQLNNMNQLNNNNFNLDTSDKSDKSNFSMSTPIKQLHQQLKPTVLNDTNQQLSNLQPPQIQQDKNQIQSTKITDLKDRLAQQTMEMKPENFTRIGGNNSSNNFDTQSIAGSDAGSLLDLDLNDFENSIQ